MDAKLQHTGDEPSKIPYQLIKQITNDFDEERILGRGTYGTVYKGVHPNRGEIAVKVLHNISGGLDDTKFRKEFNNLRGLKHQNIVELVGFCNELVEGPAMYEGKQVTAVSLRTALCFEYVHNGSLHKHISDQNTGFNWHTRYKIIKGLCEGLKYLREGLGYPVMHFDLKPDNILLDKNMLPKIADFGLSKLFGEENTTRAMSAVGTLGYWPPEYIKCQIISSEFDIFSLGVIIVKIMTGHEGYNSTVEMMTRKSVKLVHESWKKKLRETVSHTSLKAYCNQVKRCIEIALHCLKPNRQERPTIQEIVSSLTKTETMIADQGMQNEQFYQGGRASSILLKKNSSISIMSRSSSDDFSDVVARAMPFALLKHITNDFCGDRLIGRAGYGRVYKGIYRDGQVIAVKLYPLNGIDDKQFQNEIEVHKKVHHQNVAPLVGYCHATEEVVVPLNGKHAVVGLDVHMAICLEYFPNGSLYRYISDMNSGLDWYMRYRIIKGMCEGVRYLHEGLKSPVIHMNLQPTNILLDDNMMPKIGDFGMARLIGAGKSDRTLNMNGARGYMPPEFIEKQVITKKYDIYSLGVIIVKLMTGSRMYLKRYDMSYEKFIELAHENWRERLQETVDAMLVEGYCQQVKKCLEIALKCLESNRRRRPSIGAIVHMLEETETLIPQLEIVSDLELLDSEDSDQLLHVHPLELCFLPTMSSSEVPRKKVAMISSCLVQLNNKGNDRVAFMLVAKSPKRYLTKKPLCGVVPPMSAYTLTLTMLKQQPLSSDIDDDFFTLYSVAVDEYDLQDVDKHSISIKYDNFFKKAKETAGASQEVVQEMTLKVLCCQQQADHGTSSSEPTRPTTEVINTSDAQQVSSIDVHPTEPWIMTTNDVGSLRAWNYKTMATLNSIQNVTDEPVHVAKFIAREKWLVAGDSSGGMNVYSYDQNQLVDSLDAHDSCITSLAVHPMDPFVLSTSFDDDHLIKLWDWSKDWKCTRTFRGHTDRVTQVKFNPEDKDSFASASWDGTVKTWSICSDNPSNIMTLKMGGSVESLLCIDYFTRNKRQHLIVGCKDRTAQIWKFGMDRCVDNLEGHGDHISAVSLHPELPLLITGSLDGTVRVWNSTTYKLENIIGFNLGAVYALGCIKGSRR